MSFERIGDVKVGKVLNERPHEDTLTVCIAGVPRGGTTMVAAAVHALGLYLGPEEDLRGFTFEDQRMNRPYLEEQHACIKERDAAHDKWGWKDPGAIHPLNELAHALRNPRVILVFRDTLASIQAEQRFDEENEITGRTFTGLVESSMQRLETNWKFVERTRLPLMLVSYERAINNREVFVSEVENFLGITPTNEQRQEAISRISQQGGYYQW